MTNSGNTTETNVSVTDTGTTPAGNVTATCSALSGPTGTCSGASVASLAPGQTATFTGSYTVTQADVDHGSVKDTAVANGTSPSGPVASAGSSVTIPVTQSPSLLLAKSANVTTVSQVGQQVTYSFAVTNTGNVTVNAIAIADVQAAPSLNSSLSNLSCPDSSLAPTASETCTATYTVTQQDLNHGSITDTATATGKTTVGASVTSNPSSATIVAVQTIMSGRAYDVGLDVGLAGVALVGPVTVNDTGGVETAAATATPTPCVAAAAVKDLTITGDVCAGVQTVKSVSTSIATSSIANLALGVAGIPAIDLQAVQSTSTTSCSGSTGSVTIAYLSVGSVVVISKPTVIAPNTGLNLGVVTLELNQQIPFNIGGDAGLTVNAVHVTVNALGLAGVNLVVGSSTSDIECAVPTQAPVLTGEANDVELLGAALGTTVGANVVRERHLAGDHEPGHYDDAALRGERRGRRPDAHGRRLRLGDHQADVREHTGVVDRDGIGGQRGARVGHPGHHHPGGAVDLDDELYGVERLDDHRLSQDRHDGRCLEDDHVRTEQRDHGGRDHADVEPADRVRRSGHRPDRERSGHLGEHRRAAHGVRHGRLVDE